MSARTVAPAGTDLASAFLKRVDEEIAKSESGEVETCFILDGEGVEDVLAAAGTEAPVDSINFGFLQDVGSPDVSLSCGLGAVLGEADFKSAEASAFAGLTDLDAEGFEKAKLEQDQDRTIEGDAPGLNPEDVVGLGSGSVSIHAWVSDGFFIALALSDRGDEAGFAALPVLVAETAKGLGVS